MTDGAPGRTVRALDAEVDSPAIFDDPPLGHVGRLTHARLSWSGREAVRLAVTIEVAYEQFTALEAAEAFGNRAGQRTDNLRGGFDPEAPVEVTLWLADEPLARHFAGDEAENRAALVRVLQDLASEQQTPLTAPALWIFESAVQPVPGSAVAAGYRNRGLAA